MNINTVALYILFPAMFVIVYTTHGMDNKKHIKRPHDQNITKVHKKRKIRNEKNEEVIKNEPHSLSTDELNILLPQELDTLITTMKHNLKQNTEKAKALRKKIEKAKEKLKEIEIQDTRQAK